MFITSDIQRSFFYRNIWPLAAICCLGLVAFLIAVTIVLALIPVYLPTKDLTINSNTLNAKFLFVYQQIIFHIDILHDL